MDRALFLRSVGTQALLVGALFALLVALPLDAEFFEDNGIWTGPLAWIACTIGSARLLAVPAGFVLFAGLAGGVCGLVVSLVAGHSVGLVISLLVFGASCAGYDPERDDVERLRT